jgi:2,4-dienoyl-CoA reductase-like NADH-dependent reductase (Old Yellow Enzyme family)/thioredoxin reductase
MTELKHLFQPIQIGTLEIKNRIVLLAADTGYGDNDMVTERQKEYYAARARGGAGLLITGLVLPSSMGKPVLGRMGIYHDRFIPGLRQLVDAVHSEGAKIAIQLSLQYFWARGEGAPVEEVGPSAISTRRNSQPRELNIEEIQQIIDEYSEGTRRAREAGFDAVEFHCGIGYLISRFISPCSNKRSDEYGGSLENRMRFILEIIASSKRKAGSDYPLICRVSADEFMEGGHTLEDTRKLVPMLEPAGVHCLNIGAGWHECRTPLVHMSVPRGAFVYLAEESKKVAKVPVIAAYRINDPILADRIIAEGRADIIGMGRALIADPELPNKASEGRLHEIRPCIACGHCLDVIMLGAPLVCAVNPQVGKEAEYTSVPTAKPKKVFVIGGGPAGMEAAAGAAERGHQVTLFEKGPRLGGNLLLAAVPSYKREISNLTNYLEARLKKSGAQIKLNQEVDEETIAEGKPEVVLIAVGATPLIPDIPGVNGGNVVTALEVLGGEREVGEHVVIVGGGMIGCEAAEYLADKGKQVTILEMLERIGADIGMTTRWVIMQRLRNAGIAMETNAKVEQITDKGIMVSRDGSVELFTADSVVLAVGLVPRNDLAQRLEGGNTECHCIGDCTEAQKIIQAIEDGFHIAREI